MRASLIGLWLSLLVAGTCSLVQADDTLPGPIVAEPRLEWSADYVAARSAAREGRQQLLIFFEDPAHGEAFGKFRRDLLADPEIAARLATGWRLAALPTSVRVRSHDQEIALLDHESFREMHGRPGLAIVDCRDDTLPHFGTVVSVLPLGKEGAKYRTSPKDAPTAQWLIPRSELLALLDLPPGSLTQRTLIFAVRTHGERPASADSLFHPLLAAETESHSSHQARLRVQGHHGWEQRFHAINAKLADGSLATEVCAESWPGQPLVEAARECVHSWRQSAGHWNAVRGQHRAFGYDMKRGTNGVWYATGIFARGAAAP